MKRYSVIRLQILIWSIIVFAGSSVWGQKTTKVQVNAGDFTDVSLAPVNLPGFPFRWPLTQILAPKPEAPAVTDLSDLDPKGKCIIWLEYGDGGFTVKPASTRDFTSSPASAFLMAIPLYDTTRGKDGLIARYLQGASMRTTLTSRLAAGHNDQQLIITNDGGVKLTPSAHNIVPGEPLQLAVTYKLSSDSLAIIRKKESQYYVLLYYNNDGKNIFGQYSATGPGTLPAYLRAYKSETLTALTQADFVMDGLPTGYSRFAAFELPVRNVAEYNFFITLSPNKKIVVGDESSIKAVLIEVAGKDLRVVGQDSLSSMYVSRAFDPNTITVAPRCLVVPKKETDFKYRIQFQNLGEGPADSVKIEVSLPEGMRKETLVMGDVIFSGKKVAGIVPVGTSGNTIQFFITGHLPGTSGTPDALTNPLTMGEVNFTIKSAATLADSVIHKAAIYFHSKFAAAGVWEDPVSPDPDSTVYKQKDCECGSQPCPGNCYIILGLCWWWWVVILLVVIILLRLLFRRR
jgi:hypothetical protein